MEESVFESSAKISGSSITVSLSKTWLEDSSEEDWAIEFDIMDIEQIALTGEVNNIEVKCANAGLCIALTLPDVYAETFDSKVSFYDFINCSGSADVGLPLVGELVLWSSYHGNEYIEYVD